MSPATLIPCSRESLVLTPCCSNFARATIETLFSYAP